MYYLEFLLHVLRISIARFVNFGSFDIVNLLANSN